MSKAFQIGSASVRIPGPGSKEYLITQRKLIESEEHRCNTRWAYQLDHEATLEQCARHWNNSGASMRFREVWVQGMADRLMRQVGMIEQVE